MKVEIEVISRETIKPSSPITDHLRNYQFSFLDQISSPVFMPLVLFYPADVNNKFSNLNRSNQLKNSLSEALTRFYPLAGRVVDNVSIHCNDEGVPYVEARVHCQLSDVISNPMPNELNKFLPYELDDVRDLCAAVQVTFFNCGGIAVALAISHKVADASSLIMFLNSWAAIARGDTDIPCPRFDSATLFPPRDIAGYKPNIGIVKENIVTRRFVFTASKISSLRDKYAANKKSLQYPRRPTRIEALYAFVWSRFMAATEAKADHNKTFIVTHAVNLRTRVDPPLPQSYFGNISGVLVAVPCMDTEQECCGILDQMSEAISNVNGDYVTKLGEGDKHFNFIKERAQAFSNGEVVSFSFTSLCRFPLYEADFGWGRPTWVGSASLKFKNLVVFLDTSSGDGIEAWVNLKGEDMAKFEVDKELITLVSPSTSTYTSKF